MLLCIRHFSRILLLSAFLGSLTAGAQSSTTSSSPYSRYGIGDIQYAGISQTLGMGGIGVALSPGLMLNFSNPASYAALQYTTFEGAINGNYVQLRSTEKRQDISNASLGYFALGFPGKPKKWGLGFGIVPLSNIGYSIDDPQINSLGQDELHVYEGSGGINQFFVSGGATISKKLRVGATASYLFGDIMHERRVEFGDPSMMNTRVTDTRTARGFYFNFGLLYTLDSLRLSPSDSLIEFDKKIIPLKDSLDVLSRIERDPDKPSDTTGFSGIRTSLKSEISNLEKGRREVTARKQRGNWSTTFGLTFSPEARLNSNRTYVAETFKYLDNSTKDFIVVNDTAVYTDDEKGEMTLPYGLGFGVSLRKGTQWLIGVDLRLQNWSEFSSYGESDSLSNSWRLSAGAQFVPDDRSFSSYLKQIQYMAGFHYSQTFLDLEGTQLTEIGISAGFGLPIRRGMSHLRLMAEAGRRGTTDNNLLEENFIRFTFGFTLNDRWFTKQRYD